MASIMASTQYALPLPLKKKDQNRSRAFVSEEKNRPSHIPDETSWTSAQRSVALLLSAAPAGHRAARVTVTWASGPVGHIFLLISLLRAVKAWDG